jgi:hypothetical protein
MAKFVTTDYKILLGTADFSESIAAVTLEVSADEQETTAFGDTFRTRIAGLKDASISLDFHQDFGASSVDATLWPLLGSTVSFTVTPTSGTVSATNPSYTGTALVTQYSPFANSVGDLATLSVTWPVSGEVTRGTGA